MLYEVHYLDILCIDWLKSDVVVFYIQQRENRRTMEIRLWYLALLLPMKYGSSEWIINCSPIVLSKVLIWMQLKCDLICELVNAEQALYHRTTDPIFWRAYELPKYPLVD